MVYVFFFFKQKTAYEMRISDWSSDVCSSDLLPTDNRSAQGASDRLQVTCADARRNGLAFSLKEVIQPHLPIRLPCYDFTPVMNHSVVSVPLAVRSAEHTSELQSLMRISYAVFCLKTITIT